MIAERDTAANDERLRRLQLVTDAALAQLDVEDLLIELLDRVRELLHVDTATVLLLDSTGEHLTATAARGIEEEVRQGVRLRVGQGFAGQVASLARPLAVQHIEDRSVLNRVLVNRGVTSMLGVPMIVGGQVIGVLHVGTLSERHFTDDDVDLLQRVADRISLATQTRVAGIDRAATVALQRSLLPARPPAVPGLDVATRYVPGAQVGLGGDWYDMFALPDGHVGVVIGDVAGHGLRAAVVMGRIRSALRAYALETNDPADVLTRLDRKIQLFEPGAMATAIYAVIPPSRDEIVLSVAGHLPPAIMDANGAARVMRVVPDMPLGAHRDAPRRSSQAPLNPGTLLLLYTDGLIERRTRSLEEGFKQLVSVMAAGDPETVCTSVMAGIIGGKPAEDDIAVLALRLDTAP